MSFSRRNAELNSWITKAWDIPSVVEIVEWYLEEFNIINVCCALSMFARAPPYQRPAPQTALVSRVPALLDQVAPRNVSSALHAIGKLGWATPEVTTALAKACSLHASAFQAQEQANALHGLANCAVTLHLTDKSEDAELSGAVNAAVEGVLRHLDPAKHTAQGLSNIAHAVVALNRTDVGGPAVVACVARAAAHPPIKGVELAQLFWALSSLRDQAVEAPARALAARLAAAQDMTPQQASSIALALGKLGVAHSEGLGALCHVDTSQLKSKDLCNFIWGMARLDYDVPKPTLRQVADRALASLEAGEAWTSRDLSNLLWSFAKLVSVAKSAELDRKVEAYLESVGGDRERALAKARCKVGKEYHLLYERIGDAVMGRGAAGGFSPRDLCNLLWGYANAGLRRGDLLEYVRGQGVAARAAFNAQETLKFIASFQKAARGKDARAMARQLESEFHPAQRTIAISEGLSVRLRCGVPRREDESGVSQDHTWARTGAICWQASEDLAAYLAGPRMHWAGVHTVIELGAGLGLPSIVAAMTGRCRRVVCTDGDPDVVELMRANCEQNMASLAAPAAALEARMLKWHEVPEGGGELGPFDLLMCADVLYFSDEASWAALGTALRNLSREGSVLLVSQVLRFPAGDPRGEAAFLERLPKLGFHLEGRIENMASTGHKTGKGSVGLWKLVRGALRGAARGGTAGKADGSGGGGHHAGEPAREGKMGKKKKGKEGKEERDAEQQDAGEPAREGKKGKKKKGKEGKEERDAEQQDAGEPAREGKKGKKKRPKEGKEERDAEQQDAGEQAREGKKGKKKRPKEGNAGTDAEQEDEGRKCKKKRKRRADADGEESGQIEGTKRKKKDKPA